MENTNVEGAALEAVVAAPKGLSFRGIWEVFIKPAHFFGELKGSPKIIVPLLAMIVVYVLMFTLLADLIVDTQIASEQFQRRMQGQQVTEPIRQMIKIQTIVVAPIAMAIGVLLSSAIAFFVGNFIMAGRATFKQLFSVHLYGGLLYAIGSFIIVPLALAKGSMMVSLSLGVLAASQGLESPLYTALSKISVFHIWEIVAVGIGLATIYNFSRNKGYTLAVISVGSLAVLHIIMAFIGGMF